jgi:hypothetical protein
MSTNIAARYGRQDGVRKRSNMDTAAQPSPRVHIFSRSVSAQSRHVVSR